MPSDEPWNLKGIEPEARDAPRQAARCDDDTFGEDLQSASAGRNSPDISPAMEALTTRLDLLAEQIERLSRNMSPPAANPTLPRGTFASGMEISSALQSIEGRLAAMSAPKPPTPEVDIRPINDALTRLDHRLEALLQEGRMRSTAIENRISAVDRSLAHLEQAKRPVTRASFGWEAGPLEPAPGPEDLGFSIESALADIERSQRALDEGAGWQPQFGQTRFSEPETLDGASHGGEIPRFAFVEFQDQFRALTEELRNLHQSAPFERALERLRGELGQIGLHLAEAAPRHTLQALEAEVHALVERVGHERSGAIDTATLAGLEAGLGEIRRTLEQFTPAEALAGFRQEVALLDSRLESLGSHLSEGTESAAAIQELAGSVAELREIATQAASGQALNALAEDVQAIRDKIDAFMRSTPSGEHDLSSLLEQRFQELAAHLDAQAHSTASVVPDQLVSLVEQIDSKLDRADLGHDNSSLLDAIAGQITRLTEHVQAADARLDTLDDFERAARDMLGELAQLRASTISAAAQAAKHTPHQSGQQSVPVAADSLRHDFDPLRETQAQRDRRTQDTLEAVHDTLERLVDRMAVVETNLRERRQAAEAPLVALRPIEPAPSLAPAVTPAGAANIEPARQLSSSAASEFSALAQARRPIDPTLPADHPLEPGTALGRGRGTASAAERIAASEAALGPAKQVPETDAKSNFIAAARRAAQAAANMSAPANAPTESEKSAAWALAALAQKFTGRRVLVLGLVLLVGAGALHLALNRVGFGEKQANTPITAGAVPTRAIATAPPPRAVSVPDPSGEAPDEVSSPLANTPEPAPHGGRTVPTVSPLTIASIQLPSDVTGTITRATGGSRPTAPLATPNDSSNDELPVAFSKKLRAAALAGNPAAEYEIAARYAEGRGVPLKLEEAARWFERAANRQLAPAQYRLGSLYEKGQGVRKDLDQARRLYRAAAGKGHGKAMHNLAVLYAEGMDGKPDFKAAAEWFRKAAQYGVADSQYNLGILYARGLGVDQNLTESHKWFELAARQGDQDAGKKRDDVSSRLDPQALAAARLAAQTFTVEPQPAEAITVGVPPGGWEDVASPRPPAKQKSSTSRRSS